LFCGPILKRVARSGQAAAVPGAAGPANGPMGPVAGPLPQPGPMAHVGPLQQGALGGAGGGSGGAGGGSGGAGALAQGGPMPQGAVQGPMLARPGLGASPSAAGPHAMQRSGSNSMLAAPVPNALSHGPGPMTLPPGPVPSVNPPPQALPTLPPGATVGPAPAPAALGPAPEPFPILEEQRKPWHVSLSWENRQSVLAKLVDALSRVVSSRGTSEQSISVLAQQLEHAVAVQTNSTEQYLQLVAERIYKLKKAHAQHVCVRACVCGFS
jgi:hypothetical protein